MLKLEKHSAEKYFAEVFKIIDRNLMEKGRVITAIEGNSGAGKSHLAGLLAKRYDCNIIHMDDFFLQSHQRTAERLEEAGGNIDYERFKREVAGPLRENKEFRYQLYDCSLTQLTDFVRVAPKMLNIIEGVYGMHPLWNDIIDIRIFLTVEPAVQQERILKRNGEFMLKRFREEWIPMENKYFEEFRIADQCDLVIDTSFLPYFP
jgi:uridine kinase